MKQFVLAAIAALTLGMGVASAQNLNGYGTNQTQQPSNSYSPVNG